ncbi:MAG: respiratory chain complex I subunit 1 family protein [Methanoculleaceae archaeon]
MNAYLLVAVVAGALLIGLYGIVMGLLLLGIDRKLAARMQARIGPRIRQPLIDVLKLLSKECIVPAYAVRSIFNLSPVVALASSLVVLYYLPIGSMAPLLDGPAGGFGDVVLVMYLLTVPALAMVAGGFASGSPYATVGAQREMVTMIAYEFPLAVAIIAIAWRLAAAGVPDPFTLSTIAGITGSTTVWAVVGIPGAIGSILLLIALALVTPAEVSRLPCDTPEAETEIAGGLLVEYSGRNLAIFTMAQGVKTLAMASLAVAIFLPWNPSWYIPLDPAAAYLVDAVFFIFKVVVVAFFSITLLRTTMARFQINRLVTMYWGYIAALTLAGMALLVADACLGQGVVV